MSDDPSIALEWVGLFDGVLARGGVRTALDDRAWLAALLEVEAGLARAEARAGVIPEAHAEAIARACRAEGFDIATLGRAAAASGNPVVPLVAALRIAVGGPAAADVHRGATSQDILDTALMLVVGAALVPLLADLDGAADAAARLADAHRATRIAGRTLLQQAVPTTFGATAAGWLVGLDAAAQRLDDVRATRLAVQLGGPAGTLAELGAAGPAVVGFLARDLGLGEPIGPWHAERTRVGELAGALGTAAGALAKPALDVVLLAQTEVAEVREGDPTAGVSSSMAHKHNPIAAIATRACAAQAPGLVATILAASAGEHQRAAGAWHAEWQPMRSLLTSVGSAAAWLRECLTHLVVDAERMGANIDPTIAGLDTADVPGGTTLVDRALEAHAARRAATARATRPGR
jgi:3-carboxy-cis,cis-muconate cycloisomerase